MTSSLPVLALVGALASVGASQTADVPLIEDAVLEDVGMYRYWQARLPISDKDVLLEGHLVDEALYVITDNGVVFALHADVGLIRWGKKLAEPDYRIYAPTHLRTADGNGHVVIPTVAKVFVMDRFSGETAWAFTPEFAPGGPAVGYDSMLHLGGLDGRFYSLVLLGDVSFPPVKNWEVLASGPVTAAPVLFGRGMLLFAAQGGRVYACRASDKALAWTFQTEGPILGDPAVDGSGVYVAGMDRSLYKLDRGTGRVIWRKRFPRPLRTGPVVSAGTVFQPCGSEGLVAVDAESGNEKWRQPAGQAFVAHSKGSDVLFTHDHRLLIVDPEKGAVRHAIDAHDVLVSVVNTRNDAVYLLGTDGRVLCSRLDGIPYLKRQQVIAARRRLNRPPLAEAAAVQPGPTGPGSDMSPTNSDPLRSRRDIRP